MIIQEENFLEIGEAISVYTLVGWLLVALIIIVIILYPIKKYFEIKAQRRIASKPRIKSKTKK